MLRIRQLCFTGIDSEKLSVEHVHVVQNGSRANVGGPFGKLPCSGDCQFFHREMRDRFYALKLVTPELGNSSRARESARHANNGNSVEQRRRVNATHESPPERRPRKRVKASRCRSALCFESDAVAVCRFS